MLRLAAVFFISMMASTALAQTNRTVLKRGDLTGTDRRSSSVFYKVVGDKPLKLLTVHIVDKGKPVTVPAK
jgi:hypothetical protein